MMSKLFLVEQAWSNKANYLFNCPYHSGLWALKARYSIENKYNEQYHYLGNCHGNFFKNLDQFDCGAYTE